MFLCRIHFIGNGAAVGQAQGRLETFRQALLDVLVHLDPVNDDVDRVFFRFLQFREVIDFIDLGRMRAGLHAKAHEALRLHLLEQVHVFALAVGDDGRQDHQLGVLGHGQHGIDHLRHGLGGQRVFRMVGAVRRAHARIQQAQIIVDFRHGAHRRARVVRGCLLFDGDGGR